MTPASASMKCLQPRQNMELFFDSTQKEELSECRFSQGFLYRWFCVIIGIAQVIACYPCRSLGRAVACSKSPAEPLAGRWQVSLQSTAWQSRAGVVRGVGRKAVGKWEGAVPVFVTIKLYKNQGLLILYLLFCSSRTYWLSHKTRSGSFKY